MGTRAWSSSDKDYLATSWGTVSIESIAKHTNRSVTAVILKARRLGLGRYTLNGDYVTLRDLLVALGFPNSYSHMYRKYDKLGLPIKSKVILSKSIRVVNLDEFWDWATENRNKLNFANFKSGTLGLEPDWVAEKRRVDRISPSNISHNRPWTKQADNLLIGLTKSNRYSYQDLSKEFNRSECAIKRRLLDLKVPYRPVPRDNHIKWTAEENMRMLELHEQGYSTKAIADILGKTQLSISDRIKSHRGMGRRK